jgi:hypothetical protein
MEEPESESLTDNLESEIDTEGRNPTQQRMDEQLEDRPVDVADEDKLETS